MSLRQGDKLNLTNVLGVKDYNEFRYWLTDISSLRLIHTERQGL